MNMLDMMNKLTALSEAKSTNNDFSGAKGASAPDKSKTITHKGGVKTTDDKGVKHQGKYGNEYQGDDEDEAKNKATKPAGAARGRGRPRKDADATGAVNKPDWSAFGAKKDIKLKPWDKNKTTKHSAEPKGLKDWIENLDKALNENSGLTATPLSGATAIKNAQGQQVATATTPQAAAMMTKGDVTLTDPTKKLGEEADGKTARIFYNSEFDEYTVKFYQNGKHIVDADYFTDDKEDARATAKAQTQQEEELSERDDREDDEHGGGPTPWENPDQGCEPKNQVAEGRKDTGMRKGHDKKQAAFVAKWEMGGKKSSKPAGKFVKPEDDGKRDPSDDEDTAALRPGHDKKQAAFVAKWEKGGKKQVSGPGAMAEGKKTKPDFLDKDKDGNKKEPFKKAVKDAADSKYDSRAGRRNTKDDIKAKMAESKMSDLDLDLKDKNCSDEAFKKQYGKTKAEMRALVNKKPVKEAVVPDSVKKDDKGRVLSAKTVPDKKPDAKKSTSKIKESILRESHETLQHVINRFKNEVKRFVAGEELDHELYDALYDYYCDQGEMPYGTMKARDGDPFEWVMQRFDRDVQDHDVPVDEGKYSQDYFTANKPSSVRQAAEVPAKPLPTPWSRDPVTALTDRVVDKFSAPKFGDVQFESWTAKLDNLLSEGLNVVANTGLGDGPDSVTISATDDDAQQLLSIVKTAGLGMFAGDETQQDGESSSMSSVAAEQPTSDIDVVDDHDGMLALMRKLSGQGPAKGATEVDEEENFFHNPNKPADQQLAAPPEEVNVDEEETEDQREFQVSEEDSNDQAETSEEDEVEEELDEAYANSADDTFDADIDFMQNVISGGVNGRKRTQSVGSPVTIASTPMRESTNLLKDWVKLSGL